jgi:hypothetical protein
LFVSFGLTESDYGQHGRYSVGVAGGLAGFEPKLINPNTLNINKNDLEQNRLHKLSVTAFYNYDGKLFL